MSEPDIHNVIGAQKELIRLALMGKLFEKTGHPWHVSVVEDGIKTTAGPSFLCMPALRVGDLQPKGFLCDVRIPLGLTGLALLRAINDKADFVFIRWDSPIQGPDEWGLDEGVPYG